MEPWREELYHYGVMGMKWGVRRYQNTDGSYTAAGKRRYGIGEESRKQVASARKKYGNSRTKYTLFDRDNDYYRFTKADLDSINPKFSLKGDSYLINCQRCCVATELKKRGYDLTAGKNTGNNSFRNSAAYDVRNMFHDAKYSYCKSHSDVKSTLTSMPAGASGTIMGSYSSGNSHVLNWTLLKDGTVRFEDGQSAAVYDMDQFLKRYGFVENDPRKGGIWVARLDNLEPNWHNIQMAGVYESGKIPNKAEQLRNPDERKAYDNSKVSLKSLGLRLKQVAQGVINKGKQTVNKLLSAFKHSDDDWMLKYVDTGKRYMEAHYGTMA